MKQTLDYFVLPKDFGWMLIFISITVCTHSEGTSSHQTLGQLCCS